MIKFIILAITFWCCYFLVSYLFQHGGEIAASVGQSLAETKHDFIQDYAQMKKESPLVFMVLKGCLLLLYLGFAYTFIFSLYKWVKMKEQGMC